MAVLDTKQDTAMARVLLVEDEDVLRMTFEDFLVEEGYEVATAENYDEAIQRLDRNGVDVVITDIILGGKTGVDLLRTLRDRELHCPVIMITGDPSVQTASEAVRLGAFDYLPKPVTRTSLERVVRLALEHQKLINERDEYLEEVHRYRSELESIFNSVNDGIITVDSGLRVRHINKAAQRILGIESDSVTGQDLTKTLPRPFDQANSALRTTLDTRKGVRDVRVEMPDEAGRESVLVINTNPLQDGRDDFEGAVMVVRDVTRLNDLERQLENTTHYRKLIGKSAKMRDIYQLVEDLGETDSTVLIYGESGTGKELVAEALHNTSTRRNNPFVRVNCAALAEDILESELFGHVKGAFTGAVKDRVGRFESAQGGTILLDEIGDISPRLQLRLLRVLQEREFERVGDSRPIKADVRVIAATNQDLMAKIKVGEFRQDLYYRLNVVRIHIPSMRERREDIPLLVDHFCTQFNKQFRKEVSGLSPETMEIVMQYPWPGNVRELENAMERAFIVCRDTVIRPEHLPPEIRGNAGSDAADNAAPNVPLNPRTLGKDQIMAVLTDTDWNIAKSARRLGIARNTLYQKIKTYGLNRPGE